MISSFIHHNNKIHWFHHVWIKYIVVYWIEITSHKISYDSHLQSKHVWYILPMQKLLQRFRIKCNFEAFESKAKIQRQMYWIRYTLISTLIQNDLYLMRWDVFIRYKNIISSHMKCMLVVVVIHAAPNILYMLTLQMAESHFRLVSLCISIKVILKLYWDFEGLQQMLQISILILQIVWFLSEILYFSWHDIFLVFDSLILNPQILQFLVHHL